MDYLGVAEGEKVALERVLFIGNGDKSLVGTPVVQGAKVICTSKGEVKGEKIIVLRYKPKVRYRNKKGHRQLYTRLAVEEVVIPEEEKAKKTRGRKKEVKEDGA